MWLILMNGSVVSFQNLKTMRTAKKLILLKNVHAGLRIN